MPYKIISKCSGRETACVDACPFACIHPEKNVPVNARQRFYIDTETCTECGACALVCPERAIMSVAAVPRYQPFRPYVSCTRARLVGSAGGWDGTLLKTDAEAEIPSDEIEIPGDKLVVNGRVESWADLMASMCD